MIDASSSPFFVAGGTVPPGSPSYVERAADRELFDALLAGESCFVLNSRQMGKSSLAVRTIAKLNEAGAWTAFVDLTRLGATGADPDRWYAGLLAETGRALGMRSEAMAYLKANAALPAVARLFGFLRDVALASPLPSGGEGPGVRGPAPVVLLIDEIDAVRSLPFPADDLFAGLRELHNARATDPALARLTVCLLGAALPGDLIADPRRTPFNVGRRIELRDLAPEEAAPFAAVVGGAALGRVLHWTGGHPFLTQALCAALAATPPPPLPGGRGSAVDALVRERYLDARARDADTNLADVGNRLLGTGDPDVGDESRAAVLALYEGMLRGKAVPDDEANPAAARIKMSGVARVEDGLLKVRNRLYREAFDLRWIRDNLPGGELRRQRRAFYRGVLRTATMAGVVVAAIGGLAWNNARLASAALNAERKASYEAYAASMSLLPSLWQAGGLERMDDILTTTGRSPNRGWEWGYWKGRNDPGVVWTDEMAGTMQAEVSPNGKLVATRIVDTIRLFDARTLRLVDQIPVPGRSLFVNWVDDDHLLTAPLDSFHLQLVDLRKRKIVRDFGRFTIGMERPAPGRWTVMGWPRNGEKPGWLDLRTGSTGQIPSRDLTFSLQGASFSPDGRYCAHPARFADRKGTPSGAVVFETRNWSVVRRIETASPVEVVEFSPDGYRLAVGTDADVTLWDWRAGRASPSRRDLGSQAWSLRFSSDGHYLVAVGFGRQGALYRVRPEGLLPVGGALKGVLHASFVPKTHLLLAGYDRNRLIDADAYGHSDATKVGLGYAKWRQDRDGLRLDDHGKLTDVDLSGTPVVRAHLVASDRIRIGDAEGLTIDRKDPKRPVVQAREGAPRWSLSRDEEYDGRIWPFPAKDRCLVEWGSGKLRVLDLRTGTLGRTIPLAGSISELAVSRDGGRFAFGFNDGRVGLYDLATRRSVWMETVHGDWPVSEIKFSPDERTILISGSDQTATIIDAASGRLRFRLKGHLHVVYGIDESPDGRRIATGSADQTARIWDVRTGRELTNIPFEAAVSSVRFSRDGRRLFVLLEGGTLHVLAAAPPSP